MTGLRRPTRWGSRGRARPLATGAVGGLLLLGVVAGGCSSSATGVDAGASSGTAAVADGTAPSTGSGAPGSGQGSGSGSGSAHATTGDDSAAPSGSGASTAQDDASQGAADAPPGEGGSAETGSVVTPGDGAAGGCPGVFCEDFERGSLDPAIWTTKVTAMGNGMPLQPVPTVQTKMVAHGKYAVQFHSDPGKPASYDFIITSQPKLRGHHFGRAYFNATPRPPGAHTEFLFAGTAGFPNLKYLEVAGIGAAWQLTFVSLPNGGESYASGGALPPGRWMCLEWELNDTPDQASVFVDGKQAPDFTRPSIVHNGVSTGLVGGFTDFGFGYYSWHPTSATYAYDLYYDDIVLDTKRIGCLP